MLQKLVLLAMAGGMGALARYGLSGFVQKISGMSFPWGTVIVNLTGCFLAGLLWSLFENRWNVSGETRTVVLVGFMGAFSTFSTFIFETGDLLRSAQWMYAAANLTIQNGIGLLALFTGMAFGRLI
jgi:fluoride exporter